ncbi:hypothetical protein CDEF62S_02617 [Castellaniella defragrans]
MPIADLNTLDRALVVGSFLRKDHPLLAQRLRQAAKRGMQLSLVDSVAVDPLVPVTGRMTVKPSALVNALAEVAVALAGLKSQPVPEGLAGVTAGEAAQGIAASLASGERVAVLMGNLAVSNDQAAQLAANAQAVAKLAGGRLGFLTPGGNTVGGYLAGVVPSQGGRDARGMLGGEPLKAYVVLHAEPLLDSELGERAVQTLKGSAMAVALTSFKSAAEEWADVMLPIAPFTETSGTFVNAEGRAQSFKGVAATVGDTRPGWKVLRVLGNLLGLQGFDDEDLGIGARYRDGRRPGRPPVQRDPPRAGHGGGGRGVGARRRAAHLSHGCAGAPLPAAAGARQLGSAAGGDERGHAAFAGACRGRCRAGALGAWCG